MLRRSSASAFMPDAYVFPGGTVDASDRADGDPPGWNAERFEAEYRSSSALDFPHDQPRIESTDARALVWAATRELAEEAAIRIDPSELRLFSHWITPAREPRRYNTFFFVAAAPAGQHGRADAFETHDAQWIAPVRALEAAARSELRIMYPTSKHLERLAQFQNVRALLAYTTSKPIVTIMPRGLPEEGFSLPHALEGNW